jgi:hypothetical protein
MFYLPSPRDIRVHADHACDVVVQSTVTPTCLGLCYARPVDLDLPENQHQHVNMPLRDLRVGRVEDCWTNVLDRNKQA